MTQISRNEYGSIVVIDTVLEKQIIAEVLSMGGIAIPCNKKGKIIKEKSSSIIDTDYSDAIIVTDTIKENSVKLHLITLFGESISNITEEIFIKIGQVYDALRVKRPDTATIYIMGMKTTSGVVVKRNIEVQHNYD